MLLQGSFWVVVRMSSIITPDKYDISIARKRGLRGGECWAELQLSAFYQLRESLACPADLHR